LEGFNDKKKTARGINQSKDSEALRKRDCEEDKKKQRWFD